MQNYILGCNAKTSSTSKCTRSAGSIKLHGCIYIDFAENESITMLIKYSIRNVILTRILSMLTATIFKHFQTIAKDTHYFQWMENLDDDLT